MYPVSISSFKFIILDKIVPYVQRSAFVLNEHVLSLFFVFAFGVALVIVIILLQMFFLFVFPHGLRLGTTYNVKFMAYPQFEKTADQHTFEVRTKCKYWEWFTSRLTIGLEPT